jgi:hypothetical protein
MPKKAIYFKELPLDIRLVRCFMPIEGKDVKIKSLGSAIKVPLIFVLGAVKRYVFVSWRRSEPF